FYNTGSVRRVLMRAGKWDVYFIAKIGSPEMSTPLRLRIARQRMEGHRPSNAVKIIRFGKRITSNGSRSRNRCAHESVSFYGIVSIMEDCASYSKWFEED